MRKIYRKLIDFIEVFLQKLLETNINRHYFYSFYFLVRLHLHTLYIIGERNREFTKFKEYLDSYLNTFPQMILKFRNQAGLASKSPADIEHYQSLIFKQQQVRGFNGASARLIDSNTFLVNASTHAYLDTYIKSRILAGYGYKNVFVCLNKKQRAGIKNMAMLSYWKHYIQLIEPQRARKIFGCRKNLHTEDITWAINLKNKMTYIETAKYRVESEWNKKGLGRPLHLCDAEHIHNGKKAMSKLGLPKNAWFVVLHVRDNGFQNGDWQKQNPYDDYRNADIETYREGVEFISEIGGYVVRVGDPRMKPFQSSPNLIDYAHSSIRSTYLDTYLFAMCKFFIGTSSGPILTPQLFGTPTLATNFAPIGYRAHTKNSVTISKKYYSKPLGRILNLQEALNHTCSHETHGYRFKENQISLIDNSSDEISSAIIEMNGVVDSNKTYSKLANSLQQAADYSYETRNGYPCLGRLGEKYLMNMSSLENNKIS